MVDPFVQRFERVDKPSAIQLKKALPSIPQNFAEALRRVGGDRSHLLTVSLGSCDEVRCLMDIALICGIITPEEAIAAEGLGDRYSAMAYRVREKLA